MSRELQMTPDTDKRWRLENIEKSSDAGELILDRYQKYKRVLLIAYEGVQSEDTMLEGRIHHRK